MQKLNGTDASLSALHALPPGTVQPEGWLREYMEKQASQLEPMRPRVSWPFTRAYWTGEEGGESWWPWEQKANWIDGAVRLAIVLQNERLMAQVRTSIDYTLTHADSGGYLGPKLFEAPQGDYHRWPQNIFFRNDAATRTGMRVAASLELFLYKRTASKQKVIEPLLVFQHLVDCVNID